MEGFKPMESDEQEERDSITAAAARYLSKYMTDSPYEDGPEWLLKEVLNCNQEYYEDIRGQMEILAIESILSPRDIVANMSAFFQMGYYFQEFMEKRGEN